MSILESFLLIGLVVWLCLAITNMLFPNKNKVKYQPIPPKSNQLMFTTDIVITNNTKWFNKEEFFGKEDK